VLLASSSRIKIGWKVGKSKEIVPENTTGVPVLQ